MVGGLRLDTLYRRGKKKEGGWSTLDTLYHVIWMFTCMIIPICNCYLCDFLRVVSSFSYALLQMVSKSSFLFLYERWTTFNSIVGIISCNQLLTHLMDLSIVET